jgi:hypothetical protein
MGGTQEDILVRGSAAVGQGFSGPGAAAGGEVRQGIGSSAARDLAFSRPSPDPQRVFSPPARGLPAQGEPGEPPRRSSAARDQRKFPGSVHQKRRLRDIWICRGLPMVLFVTPKPLELAH